MQCHVINGFTHSIQIYRVNTFIELSPNKEVLFCQDLPITRREDMRITPSVRFEKRPRQQHEGTARTDESKALKNWQMRMMERKKQQGYISSKCQENLTGSEVIKNFHTQLS